MRNRVLNALLILLPCVVLAGVYVTWRNGRDAVRVSDEQGALIPYSGYGKLAPELAQSRRVEFLQSATASKPSIVLQTLGLLSAAAEEKLKQTCASGVMQAKERINALWQEQKGDYAPSDFLSEASDIVWLESWRAALECLAKQNYWTVKAGDKVPVPRDAEVFTAFSGGRVDGQLADIVFILPHDTYPELRAAKVSQGETQRAVLEAQAGEFNNLDYEARRRRWEEHTQAVAQIKELRKNPNQEERLAKQRELMKGLIGPGLRFEPGSYYLTTTNRGR